MKVPSNPSLGEGRRILAIARIATRSLIRHEGRRVGLVGRRHHRTRVGAVAIIPLRELVATQSSVTLWSRSTSVLAGETLPIELLAEMPWMVNFSTGVSCS